MRLTNHMRRRLVSHLVEDVQRVRSLPLRIRENALATQMVIHKYGSDVFDRCLALPRGWLTAHKSLTLSYAFRNRLPKVSLSRSNTDYSTFRTGLTLTEYAVLPNSMSEDWDEAVLGPELTDRVGDLWNDLFILQQEIEMLRAQALKVVDGFYTVEKLATGWPSGYAHLPQDAMLKVPVQLPAIRTGDLDARIAALKGEAA